MYEVVKLFNVLILTTPAYSAANLGTSIKPGRLTNEETLFLNYERTNCAITRDLYRLVQSNKCAELGLNVNHVDLTIFIKY